MGPINLTGCSNISLSCIAPHRYWQCKAVVKPRLLPCQDRSACQLAYLVGLTALQESQIFLEDLNALDLSFSSIWKLSPSQPALSAATIPVLLTLMVASCWRDCSAMPFWDLCSQISFSYTCLLGLQCLGMHRHAWFALVNLSLSAPARLAYNCATDVHQVGSNINTWLVQTTYIMM